MQNRFVLVCLLGFFIVRVYQALPSFSMQNLKDIDHRNLREMELFSKKALRIVQAKLSQECSDAVFHLLLNDSNLLPAYIDAAGKIPSGILEGDSSWLGSYSTCKNISSAHYCLANVLQIKVLKDKKLPLRWGVCVPSACSEHDVAVAIEDIAAFHLKAKTLNSTRPDPIHVNCVKPLEYGSADILCLIICGTLGLLCLFGTLYDLLETPLPSKKSNEENVVQNDDAVVHEDTSFYSDRDALVNHGSMSPSAEIVPRKKPIIIRFFKCFSIIANTKKIMDTKTAPGAITSINGMRVLSISWVVLGHAYLIFVDLFVANNFRTTSKIIHRFSFQAIENATLSVDSFFFLSGLLVSYIGLRRMKKNNGRLPLLQFYLHRYLRLTPTYMFCILFFTSLFKHVGEGPLWDITQLTNKCNTKWWTNLLYINNFYPEEFLDECMRWSWYLANDFQFYCIAPLFLYAMYRFKLPGMALTVGSFLVASFIATGAIVGYYHFVANPMGTSPHSTNYVYIKPYCRISPYLVGIVLGYVFVADKTHSFLLKLRTIPRMIFLVIGWSIAFTCAFSSLYGLYKKYRADNPIPLTDTENVVYVTFSRFAWALSLAWVIYVCHAGFGGLVDNILSARFWIPLSRLTYSVYLVHPMVLGAFYGSLQSTVAYTDFLMVIFFLGCLMVSYGLSFILAIAIEFPTMQLEKLFD
ncbi:nose resistant to fluoxetine protein 6 isoform X2 [Exaiptasia diaphana]|uniref:Nose resistant-to-fluoxetine protein N-terminal domain-containing protein n=1 Tax=Exaiptasia diaphana TaxID=2652724 RepID=A0A913YI52_EXADI|nr:nose resistant to fluoxetine protein 6 isoform X2 [Exaiptasia diaphana]